MSMSPDERKLARMDAFERRIRDRRLPPIFTELETGQSFFFKDRIFLKVGPVLAQKWRSETRTRMDPYDEVAW